MTLNPHNLAAVAAFKGLDSGTLALLQQRLDPLVVPAGAVLVEEGDEAGALFIVVAGRFSVTVAASPEPVAEISNGATIGEIAFFAGGRRTATCRAIRESIVLRLTREDFDEICAGSPAIWSNITATLAQRLAAETRKSASLKATPAPRPRPRTIVLVPAGPLREPPEKLEAFAAQAARILKAPLLTSSNAAEMIGSSLEDAALAHALNMLEARHDTIVFAADTSLTPWSKLAIRQADEIILVGHQGVSPVSGPVPLNDLEAFSLASPAKPRHRLVIVHGRAYGVQGTRHWLGPRSVDMHHHVAMNDEASHMRLWRFVQGEAKGFVACGGGAYCAAHIGLYQAFNDSGTSFDIFGGSSGGAAMAAAFCEGLPAAEISARVDAMFVAGKAMARYTLPRYGLLDHTHFDRHLQAQYGHTRIEDLWKPYFAVALDLTDVKLEVIRTGPVWSAIRASAAIPGLLPPYIDSAGHLLVDGSVAANVPIDVMHQIKTGPNVVVTFDPPQSDVSSVSYDALPGRPELMRRLLNPWGPSLPKAPSAGSVVVRTLMANRNHFEKHLEPSDWLLMPPLHAISSPLDWKNHRRLTDDAYAYAKAEIAKKSASQR